MRWWMVASKRETTRIKSTITKSKVVLSPKLQYPFPLYLQRINSSSPAQFPQEEASKYRLCIRQNQPHKHILSSLLFLIARSLVINE